MKSLQQQLIEAGLANKEKAARVGKQKRKQRRQSSGGKGGQPGPGTDAIAEARRRKQASDLQLEKARKAQAQARERRLQARQIIRDHRLDTREGDVPFQYLLDNKIKRIYVTAEQLKGLANGELAVVRSGEQRPQVVPADLLGKIQERDPSVKVAWNDPAAPSSSDADDEYAEYQVPDDLTW